MRTTLKRGIGRGASMNGDGRAILPPGSLTPMIRYEQPPRKRRGLVLVGKFFLGVAALMVLLVGAFGGGWYLFVHHDIGKTAAKGKLLKVANTAGELKVASPNQPATALVIGYDKRPHIAGSRSDTIILMRAQPHPAALTMLSFPRDLRVPIHCPGKLVSYDKINAAFDLCGFRGTLDTVKALTGVPINYIIAVNFTGFRDIVNKMGGVWVDVDRRYYHSNAGLGPGQTYDQINIQPGYQKLMGGPALHFVRYRHTDSDFVRNARQQLFIKAMRAQIQSQVASTSLPGIIGAITSNVQVAQPGGGAVPDRTVLQYALFAYHLSQGRTFQIHINGLTAPTIGSVSYAEAPPGAITQAVHEFQNPNIQAPSEAGQQIGLKKPHKSNGGAPPPARTTITVLNGNGVAGAATQAATGLHQQGYQIVYPPNGIPANAPRFNYFRTRVYFDPSHKRRNRAAAQKVATLFGDGVVGLLPHALVHLCNGSMVCVVVGRTFHGSLAPSPSHQLPPKQPPYVEPGLPSALPLLKRYVHRAPFTLEVPKLIERNSAPDSTEVPIRYYSIDGNHRAVRLVFLRGDGTEYYGIQETNWNNPPILNGGEQHKIKGRRYTFYWNGSNLHMVVLHQNGATYWVVNSLMDSLSNETMVAIAKSLRPLPLKHHA